MKPQTGEFVRSDRRRKNHRGRSARLEPDTDAASRGMWDVDVRGDVESGEPWLGSVEGVRPHGLQSSQRRDSGSGSCPGSAPGTWVERRYPRFLSGSGTIRGALPIEGADMLGSLDPHRQERSGRLRTRWSGGCLPDHLGVETVDARPTIARRCERPSPDHPPQNLRGAAVSVHPP